MAQLSAGFPQCGYPVPSPQPFHPKCVRTLRHLQQYFSSMGDSQPNYARKPAICHFRCARRPSHGCVPFFFLLSLPHLLNLLLVTGVANRNGQIIASGGDSYILLVKWDSEGRVHSEAISPFGASLYNPNSKHFNDQTELFASNQLRKVRFYREDLQEFTSYTPYTAPTCN